MNINSNANHPLTIFSWNANGLRKHLDELQHILTNTNTDIALISETHFTSTSCAKIHGFNSYYSCHPDGTAHAGSAIYIKSSIPHHPLPSYISPHIQACSVSIVTHNNIPITVSAIYCPPGLNTTIDHFSEFFSTLGHRFVSGGDFNAKNTTWGNRTPNTRGRALQCCINNNNLSSLAPPGPTYWPSHNNRLPDILDIFVIKLPSNILSDLTNLYDLSSDHTPIILKLGLNVPPCQNETLTPGQTDWSTFKNILNDDIKLNVSLKSIDEINNAINHLTTSIQKAVLAAAKPQTNKKTKNQTPPHIQALLTEKRKTRAHWQNFRYPNDKTKLNKLNIQIKKEIQKYKSQSYNTYVESLTTKNMSLWKATKNILRINQPTPPLRKEDNSWAITDTDKSNILAQHLKNCFCPHDIQPSPSQLEIVENFLESPLPMSLPAKATSPEEINNVIKKIPIKKSPGNDLITNFIVKNLPRKVIIYLSHLFNALLRLSYFPGAWKHSIIILILKPNKPPENPESYRPISLLPTISKIFEKILLKRLLSIATNANIIPHTQFEFRAHHSTIHQLHRTVDHISSALEKKEFCPTVFLDVSQAFDRVWHDGLLYKLKKFLPAPYFLLLKSYLSDRFFTVRLKNSYSICHPIKAGVPQGSDIAPFLYSVFTHDIPKTHYTFIGTYADDTLISASHRDPEIASSRIQNHLNMINLWANRWKIKINENKSNHVTFTLRNSDCPPVMLNNKVLPTANEVKYLGLTFDKRLTWGPHLKLKRKQVNSRLHLLRPLLKSKLSLTNKVSIYKVIIRPVWLYGIQIWGSSKPSNTRTLQAFQSICLRLITSSPWYVTNKNLHKDLKLPTLNELAKSHYTKFFSKLHTHYNPLIQKLSSATHVPKRLKRLWPRDLLKA